MNSIEVLAEQKTELKHGQSIINHILFSVHKIMDKT